ncbi:MAG TPA: hypothetical protein VMU49_05650 [Candidatus Acidoferrales bacterium]|nr:hypothetical protein [Candidatus Acidoferrales bacterium]
MSRDSGGGFGTGLVLGAALGVIAGAYLASGPAREEVDRLRSRTIELTSNPEQLRERARAAAGSARSAVKNPEEQVRRAIHEGVAAARRRRARLETEIGPSGAQEGDG